MANVLLVIGNGFDVNGKPLVPCNNFAELFARRFAFRILVCFCSCPADLQTTASRTADKCLVHLHREAGFVPKDTACIQQVSGCWLLLSQLCCTEFRCSWLRSWYRRASSCTRPCLQDVACYTQTDTERKSKEQLHFL